MQMLQMLQMLLLLLLQLPQPFSALFSQLLTKAYTCDTSVDQNVTQV